ncbi:hypothetical protein D3C84_1226250 [compost metagenome]
MDALGPRSLRFYDHGPGRLGHEQQPSDWDDLWPAYVPGRSNMYFFQRASTIYGGAREVQKNIIAKLAFGL